MSETRDDNAPRIIRGQVIEAGGPMDERVTVTLAVTRQEARAFAKLLYLNVVLSVTVDRTAECMKRADL